MGDGASGRGGGGGAGRRVGEYELLRPIGSGAYSQVWLGRHRARGTEVAVKEIAMERLSNKLRESLLSEVDILRRIRHDNVIALHESIKVPRRALPPHLMSLVISRAIDVDLQGVGAVGGSDYRLGSSGLQMLRDNNVVHRDLKPQNILLVENNENSLLKIADFGFAKFLQPFALAETLCGSPLYMAPEVMQAQKYDAKADLWSVGVILYQLVTGRPPFNGGNQIQLLKNILRTCEIRFPSDCDLSHGCIDLCRKLLRLNSVERLTVEEFVHHPFLSEHAPEKTLRSKVADIGRKFSIQLIVLATWKQAIHIGNTFVASPARESPSQDIPMKGHIAGASHLPANSKLADDACMQIEKQFLSEVEYAEELASIVGQIADGTEMPDAIEMIFQSALLIGRRGGVDEMFGKAADAMTGYMRAVSMLRFLLVEAPSLALNPPLTLTRSDRNRLRTYIDALNTRLCQMQSQRH
ncbi:Serine/threonine-protein kinase ATG1c [Zea mays]|uniref:Serine/threonine-protein kinase ATG1c n=1 Tax=Zea mays TaxID=4577 RepID=A0A3L6DD88_MAIZE|nr:Serine/threonine-protein kinase ATG1c [Zea mays]